MVPLKKYLTFVNVTSTRPLFLSICYRFIKYLLATGSGITSNQRYQQISVSQKSIYSSE